MKYKKLNVDFRYLAGNIACLSVDSEFGEKVHNDIDNEEAIILFNSLVGEKENCITVKTLQQENEQLKSQLQQSQNALNQIRKCIYKNREHYNIYNTEIEDWMYIKDKIILKIIDKASGGKK